MSKSTKQKIKKYITENLGIYEKIRINSDNSITGWRQEEKRNINEKRVFIAWTNDLMGAIK